MAVEIEKYAHRIIACPITFIFLNTLPYGDCGFTSLGTTRSEYITTWTSASKEIVNFPSKEIESIYLLNICNKLI